MEQRAAALTPLFWTSGFAPEEKPARKKGDISSGFQSQVCSYIITELITPAMFRSPTTSVPAGDLLDSYSVTTIMDSMGSGEGVSG